MPSPPTITAVKIAASGEPELSGGAGPEAERSTTRSVELVGAAGRVVVVDLGVERTVVTVVVGSSATTGTSVVSGADGSVAAVTGGGRVAGGATVVVVDLVDLVDVVVVVTIAADGAIPGCAWFPNANASIVPAFGRKSRTPTLL